MCRLCDERQAWRLLSSRRSFLKGVAATGIAAGGLPLFAPRPAAADAPPAGSGLLGPRYVIRSGSVMSLDPNIGDFAQADVPVTMGSTFRGTD